MTEVLRIQVTWGRVVLAVPWRVTIARLVTVKPLGGNVSPQSRMCIRAGCEGSSPGRSNVVERMSPAPTVIQNHFCHTSPSSVPSP